jgi:hypothetical protein
MRASFATHQDATYRADVTDFHRGVSAIPVCRLQVGEIGAVTFAGVDYEQPNLVRRFEQILARLDRTAQQGHTCGSKPLFLIHNSSST